MVQFVLVVHLAVDYLFGVHFAVQGIVFHLAAVPLVVPLSAVAAVV